MPNPQAEPATEWVELHNISDTAINIAAWKLGDAVRLSGISTDQIVLYPGDFIVLAQSKIALDQRFPEESGRVVEVASWPSLNNDGDEVRLVDAYGITADRFAYHDVFGEDYCWSRRDEDRSWGRSAGQYGSPGETNKVIPSSGGTTLRIELNSKYVSPDGDGFQDAVEITVLGCDTGECTVRLFDSQGRVVRTLAKNQRYLPMPLVWDGLSDNGSRLPVGLYILLVEREDGETAKTVVVVAR